MAISDRLNKLSTDITNAYTSIENKGGTTPANKNTNNLSTAINSIEVIEQVTAEGESLSLTNTKAMPYKDYKVKGKSEQATSILPEGYTQVEYIESTGTQYINTGVVPTNTMKIELKYLMYYTQDTYNSAFGSQDQYYLFINNGFGNLSATYWYNNAYKNLGVLSQTDYNISTYDILNNTIKNYNNELKTELTDTISATVFPSIPIYLFARNSNNSPTYANNGMKCWYFKVWNNGTLIRNMIPCYRNSDNIIGMYDTVNDVFYTNVGTGTFTKGNNVSTPSPDYPSNINSVADDVNFWNNQLENAEYDGSGNKQTATIWLVNTTKIDVKPNTTYTVSQSETPSQYRIIYFNNNTYLDRIDNTQNTTNGYKNYTFTTPTNCNKIYVQFRSTIEKINQSTYVMTPADITNVKLAKGTTATPYSPYNQGTVTIKQRGTTENNDYTFQTSPLRSLPNGVKDTIEDDGIHRRVGKVVLDGSDDEVWELWSGGTNTIGFKMSNIANLKNIQSSSTENVVLSNYFKKKPNQDRLTGDDEEGFATAVGNLYFKINRTTVNSLAEWKIWLSTHPTEVLYELATEVIEQFTQQQATTYLDIIKTGSYEGTTNIYTDEDVKPTIGVDYYKKS